LLQIPTGILRRNFHWKDITRSRVVEATEKAFALSLLQHGGIMKVDNSFDFNSDPFHQYLGLTLEETREDYARIRLNIHEGTPTGIGGSVNGGVLSTMIDMAAVPAVFTNIREGSEPAGTADLQITYLRQAHGSWIDAEAKVIKRGRQLCTIHVDIRNDDGILCATGRVLYALRTVG